MSRHVTRVVYCRVRNQGLLYPAHGHGRDLPAVQLHRVGSARPDGPGTGGGPGRTIGGDSDIQRGWLNPYRQLFGTVTARDRRAQAYDLGPGRRQRRFGSQMPPIAASTIRVRWRTWRGSTKSAFFPCAVSAPPIRLSAV
jgi:hypothetical protein